MTRRYCKPSCGAGAPNRDGHGETRARRSRAGQQVLRSHSALSAGPDLRPPRIELDRSTLASWSGAPAAIDHFSVDGTLIEAWASIKSFRRRDGSDRDGDGPGRNVERNFHGEKRSNETHRSTTDPEARLYKKGDGQPAKLCYMGHALMENRNGLAVDGGASLASGMAEREAALALLDRRPPGGRITLGADKAYEVTVRSGSQGAVGHAAHRHRRPPEQDRQAAQDGDRWAHDPPCGLCGQPAVSQAHRGSVRLDQGRCDCLELRTRSLIP